MKGVSIIIVNFNTQEYLFNCIKSLYKKISNDSNFEIIVVDNNSTDDSVPMLKNNFPFVICIQNTKNVGFGKANNIGVSIAKYKYILLLNSDTIIKEDILKPLFQFMEENPQCAAVTPKIVYPDGTNQNTFGNNPTVLHYCLNAFGVYKVLGNKIKNKLMVGLVCDFDSIKEVPHIIGVSMFFRKEVFEKVKGFDENIFLYFEETDLCNRISMLGYKFYVYPQVEVIHFLSKSMKSNIFKTYHILKSRIYYFKKRGENLLFLIYLISYVKLLVESIKNKSFKYLKIVRKL